MICKYSKIIQKISIATDPHGACFDVLRKRQSQTFIWASKESGSQPNVFQDNIQTYSVILPRHTHELFAHIRLTGS